MNALTNTLRNAARNFNATRNKANLASGGHNKVAPLTKVAEFGDADRGVGVYATGRGDEHVLFYVLAGSHLEQANGFTATKLQASELAQVFADQDRVHNTRAAGAQTETLDSESDLETDVDDDLESGEVQDAGQLQGIDRHDDPFYDNLDDDILRECTNKDCGWVGKTDRMCGTTGPLCEDCGDTTEPQTAITAEDADIEGGIETLYASPREGMSFSPDFKLHPHQQKVVDYLNKNETEAAAFEAVVNNEVGGGLVIDPVHAEVKAPKIERGRSAKRKAAKRKGNKKPRGYNAQPSLLLDKVFGRNPITLAE